MAFWFSNWNFIITLCKTIFTSWQSSTLVSNLLTRAHPSSKSYVTLSADRAPPSIRFSHTSSSTSRSLAIGSILVMMSFRKSSHITVKDPCRWPKSLKRNYLWIKFCSSKHRKTLKDCVRCLSNSKLLVSSSNSKTQACHRSSALTSLRLWCETKIRSRRAMMLTSTSVYQPQTEPRASFQTNLIKVSRKV